MKKTTPFLLSAIVIALSACVGDNNSDDGDSTGDPTEQAPSVQFGLFDGATFQQGVLGTTRTTVEGNQNATLSAHFLNPDEQYYGEPVGVIFNSPCIASGKALIQEESVFNNNGTVRATYRNISCSGDDTVTAQSVIDGQSLTASITLDTVAATLGSISFVSASPEIIGIKDTGAIPEQSTLTYRVVNVEGQAVADAAVTFVLNNDTGGTALTRTEGVTDENGLVTTSVLAGSIATTVRVTATATQEGTTTNAQSRALAITTGLPDQDSFSLAAETLNIEGWAYDGETVELTIRAADHFNNPAPDGTAISFSAEGGSIDGSCTTSGGACSVTLTSQSPRPANGRVTVVATAVGEETYFDTAPANGRYDDGELFIDMPEAFRDDNENGEWDVFEPYINFNTGQGTEDYDGPDGAFSGVLCNGPSTCADKSTITVFDNLVVVFSGSSFFIESDPGTINLTSGGQAVDVIVAIYDVNGQVPPEGTTIQASTDVGTLGGKSSYTMDASNFNGALEVPFKVIPSSTGARSGSLTIEVTTPKGNISTNSIPIQQAGADIGDGGQQAGDQDSTDV